MGNRSLNLNVFVLALCLSLTVLGIGWGVERQSAEADFRLLSETRVVMLAHKMAALDKRPKQLSELVELGLISPADLNDGWGFKLIYDEKNGEVVSLGADGLPGGEGFGKDVRCKVGSR